MVRGATSVCLAWLALTLFEPRPVAQGQIFRAGTDVVALDFSARSADGRAVTDLRREELALQIDGKPRDIVLAEVIDRGQPVGSVSSPESPGLGAPRKFLGTTFYLAVGPVAADVGLVAVKAADEFLNSLIPTDRVALVTFPGARPIVELTSDFSRIRAELPFTIGFSQTVVSGPHAGWPQFLAALASEPGRKTVIFIDEFNGPQELEAKEVARVASLADVRVYVIQPLHFTAAAGEAAPRSAYRPDNPSLVNLANLTGGMYFHPTGRAEAIFQRILSEATTYGVVWFKPSSSERDGKAHRVSLRTTRVGVDTRVRSYFAIPR